MSLLQTVQGRYGRRLKLPGLVKRLSTLRSSKYVRGLLRSYLDETTKLDPMRPSIDEDDARYPDMVAAGLAPQRPGKDFQVFRPGIHLYGFAREIGWSMSNTPANLTQEEMVERLIHWWVGSTRQLGKKGYHFAFSLDPKLSLEAGRRGIPVDAVLLSNAYRALSIYTSRYYPNDMLAAVFGCHHDRHHAHAHALVYPVTSRGRTLNMSTLSSVKLGDRSIRVDFLGTLQRAYHDGAISIQESLIADPDLTASQSRLAQRLTAVGAMIADSQRRGVTLTPETLQANFATTIAQIPTIHSLRQTQISQRESYRVPAADRTMVAGVADGFARLADAARSQAGQYSTRRAELEALAEQRRSHPGRYRRLFYVDHFGISPSGSRAFLRDHNLDDVVRPSRDFDIGHVLDEALSRSRKRLRAGGTLAKQVEVMRQTRGAYQAEAPTRHLRALVNLRSAMIGAHAIGGKPPFFLDPSVQFARNEVPTPDALASAIDTQTAAAARNEAAQHRAFDLSRDANVAYGPSSARGLVGLADPKEIATYEPPATSVPESANFMARHSAGNGVNTPEALLSDETARLQQLQAAFGFDR